MNRKIFESFERFSYKLGQQKHIKALRDGMILAMPLILVGSFFVIIQSFPIVAWEEYLIKIGAMQYLSSVITGTFGIMGMVSVFGIAKRLADSYKVDGTSAGIIALAAYFVLIPITDGAMSTGFFGSRGLFVAIVVGIITGELFRILIQKNLVIKMPDTVPPMVAKSFTSFIPALIIICVFILIDLLFKTIGFADVFQVALQILAEPLRYASNTLWGALFAVLFNSTVWLFGVHGGQLVGSIMDPVWFMNTDANRLAWQAGEQLPYIVTKPFMDNFVWVGGGGATLGLAIFLFFLAKSKQNKALGKLALVPDLFSVNEPILFGFPIVLSLQLAIPFILAPIATGIVSYLAMDFGLVHKTVGILIPWATPPIISGYLSTGGHISGSILQIVNIVITFLVYYPFIKHIDKQMFKEEGNQ